MQKIVCNIVDESEMDRVRLTVEPLARVVPDGATFECVVWTETRSEHRSGVGRVDVPFRVVSVSLVDADGHRGAGSGASVRFGSTQASPSCWGKVEERQTWYRNGEDLTHELDSPITYWGVVQSTAWRADGMADDLPEGAYRAFRDVLAVVAEHVATQCPHLWAGAEEKKARERLTAAEAAMVKARAEVAEAKKALKVAERAHDKATRKTAVQGGASVRAPDWTRRLDGTRTRRARSRSLYLRRARAAR